MNNNRLKASEGICKITDSSKPYEEGGVFEASKFAKGDGWKSNDTISGSEEVSLTPLETEDK